MKDGKVIPASWRKETKHSMKRRAPWHDYSAPGTYMLTLVVEGRKPVLGRLVVEDAPCRNAAGNGRRDEGRTGPGRDAVGNGRRDEGHTGPCRNAAGNGRLDGRRDEGRAVPWRNAAREVKEVRAHVVLSGLGEAVLREAIWKIPVFYPQVEVWRACIMPDHIHIIVRVREQLPEGKSLGSVVNGMKIGCNRAWRQLVCHDTADNGTFSHVTADNGTFSHDTAENGKQERSIDGRSRGLFERGYNDKLLFDGEQLERWKHYIDDNPRRLAVKRMRPDWFTIMHGQQIGRWTCQLVGNVFLLDIPDKMAVIVHRRYTEEEYLRLTEQWLECGERGGVLVSAAIAPKERAVLKEARERGYKIIWLRENGFPEFYKPSGEAFNACASGQLLQVSPWAHHMDEHVISRTQCLELNSLAVEIAGGGA